MSLKRANTHCSPCMINIFCHCSRILDYAPSTSLCKHHSPPPSHLPTSPSLTQPPPPPDLVESASLRGPLPPHRQAAAGGAAQPTLQQQEQRFGKRGSGQAFALGLFQILKTEDPKVIGWSASGKAFRIGDSEKFCKEIMPRFFKRENEWALSVTYYCCTAQPECKEVMPRCFKREVFRCLRARSRLTSKTEYRKVMPVGFSNPLKALSVCTLPHDQHDQNIRRLRLGFSNVS